MKVGDLLTFKSATRSNCRKAVRPITRIFENGNVAVSKYHGWDNFVVAPYEMIAFEDENGVHEL